ncbi:TetR/AcrR family transcriptional regulator [Amycolatopsis regifaucium]|uniref:TetR family transcriptional regulator n=1 Tax=Amycolatopsis regifaucium TaxID=546365 RepID=A0A154M7R4_9PSEU|nr:TetR family transcriptional regulator [Amycolatopsis regifaucium]KZB80668.1 TetR family transcriptional regulator [Amycolatopsis regifaucium]OKA07793.1 TetR family transcriptional regulator [Amycolatopsis regifaucium]SFH02216.1 DNA-binding transcriptional regulator, AcrR family [Amycolatopsis regifaucium]
MAKSEETRSLIVATALRLFAENGYDRTTMRAIAAEAGVSVGNAYYYFASKDQLIQGFYDEIAKAHLTTARQAIEGERDFSARLKTVLLTWLDVAEPYHRFGTQFFVNAADPDSPLSPFSEESTPARDASIGLMRDVIADSDAKLDPDLRDDLPDLLWLYQMGVVLFWVHDRSAGQKRSRVLVERTVPLIARLVGLSRLRVLRPVSREIVSLIRDLSKRDDAA